MTKCICLKLANVFVPNSSLAIHLFDLPLKLRSQHLVALKGCVQVFDLLAVQKLLHDARPNVGRGTNAARSDTWNTMSIVKLSLKGF